MKALKATGRRLALLAYLLTLSGYTIIAQTNEGAIAGTVLDPSGAAITGAKVEAVESATGSRYTASTTRNGDYRIPAAKLGIYSVTVTASGFKTSLTNGVQVQVGTVASLDVNLSTGSVSETVTVTADAPSLQTESSDLGTVVGTRQVLDLPLSAGSGLRSPQSFVFLAPGTVGPGTAGGAGGSNVSKISGGQNYGTSVLIDGLDTFVDENGSSIDGTEPSVEALGEFKVLTSNLPAEYGRTTGGVTSFAIKSGTNSFHGDVYEIFRNTALDANTWFNNGYAAMNPARASVYRRPDDKKNDYGLTFGGPLRIPHFYNGRDKTFFFFSWEQYKQRQGAVTTSTVPTLAERRGDFSALVNTTQIVSSVNPCTGQPVYAGQIFDPSTTRAVNGVQCRDQFAGNVVPSSRISNFAKNVLALYPAPINDNLVNNYSYSSFNPIEQTTWTIRVDQNLSSRTKLYADFSTREDTSRTNTALPAPIGFNADAGDFIGRFARAGWDFSFSPNLLNHMVLGFNRWINNDSALASAYGTDFPAALGIGNVSARQFPQISFGEAFPTLGYPIDVHQVDNGLRALDGLNWIRDRHNVQVGVDWRYQAWSPIGSEGQAGYFNFGRAQTSAINTATTSSGNGFASFLLGQVGGANLADHGVQSQFRQPYTAVYAQDDYQALPNLVFNLGVRWDFDTPRHELHGYAASFDPNKPNPAAGNIPGALVFAGIGPGRTGNIKENFAGTYLKDVAPRIGFSWSPFGNNSRVVLRGGYGILYGQLVYSDHGNNLQDGFNAYPSFSSLDGYNAAFPIASGFPAYTRPPFINPSASNYRTAYGGVSYIAPGFNRPAMVQNWTLQTQNEFAPDLIFTLGYVGQHSTRLRSGFDPMNNITQSQFALGKLLNLPVRSPQAQAAGIKAPFATFNPGLSVAQAIRPFPQYFGINTDCCNENYGQSTYNSMQATLERRFRNGLNLLAAYTWSKTITDADSALPAFQSFNGGGANQNAINKKAEKSISNQDIPNILVVSYLYELPVGKGKRLLSKGGVTNAIAGGWQIGGVHRYQSGQPYAFCCGTGIPGYSGSIRFNRIPGQPLESAAKRSGHYNVFTDRIFNGAALANPNSADRLGAGGAYLFGDMPRITSEVRTQFFLNEDMSLIKRTQITEGVSVNFHADFFNVFNRHIFNRVGELTPFGSTFVGSNNSFGLITSTVDSPRNIQLQLKVEF